MNYLSSFSSLLCVLFSGRWVSVWRRNFLVWRKIAPASLSGHLADPLIYLCALGIGLGSFIGKINGISYISFLATGIVASSAMVSASLESNYSVFTRMNGQRTWDALLHTPLTIGDVVFGEAMWSATKAAISSAAIIIVSFLLGAVQIDNLWFIIPIIMLMGICFSCMALIMTALARNYEFFMFYHTLFLTPTIMLSGVFFPIERLPDTLATIFKCLPLYHAVALVRNPLLGHENNEWILHLIVLVCYTVIAFYTALVLFKKRFVQ